MKKIIITITLLSLLSCGYKSKDDKMYQPHFQETFFEVALDSTSSWQQIIDAADLLADSLSIIAEDINNYKYRLAAQKWGYEAINMLSDLYELQLKSGVNVAYSDIRPIIDKINEAASAWIEFHDDVGRHLFRDHFYISRKESGKPIPGYFTFKVTTPICYPSDVIMTIIFPTTANKNYPPLLAFKNYTSDKYSEETDYLDAVLLEDELKVHAEIDEEIVYAGVDIQVVDMMCHYDIMYVMFNSSDPNNGIIDEVEITRVELAPFHEKWNKQ